MDLFTEIVCVSFIQTNADKVMYEYFWGDGMGGNIYFNEAWQYTKTLSVFVKYTLRYLASLYKYLKNNAMDQFNLYQIIPFLSSPKEALIHGCRR